MQLEYKLSNRVGVPLIILNGRFDAEAAAFLKSQITNLVNEQQPNLVIDMQGVSFVDSLGLTALVSGLKLCRRSGGFLRLIGLQPAPRMLFEITRLDKAFQLFDNADQAFADFTQGH